MKTVFLDGIGSEHAAMLLSAFVLEIALGLALRARQRAVAREHKHEADKIDAHTETRIS